MTETAGAISRVVPDAVRFERMRRQGGLTARSRPRRRSGKERLQPTFPAARFPGTYGFYELRVQARGRHESSSPRHVAVVATAVGASSAGLLRQRRCPAVTLRRSSASNARSGHRSPFGCCARRASATRARIVSMGRVGCGRTRGVSGRPMTTEPVMTVGCQNGPRLVRAPGVFCDQECQAVIVSWGSGAGRCMRDGRWTSS